MSTQKIGVAFLGAGTVGRSAIEETMHVAAAENLLIRGVLVRDTRKKRPFNLPVTEKFETLLDDPEIRIIVSLLGDEDAEYRYITEALRKGKFVVTANKEVVAKKMPQLFRDAEAHGGGFLFEAAVGGGIQIVDNLLNRYGHNTFTSFAGIVNGTTNHMLTEMAKGKDYAVALKEAQDAGLAEPDPTNDVGGYDSRSKLSIIASLAFKQYVPPKEIHREGITRLRTGDFEYARRLGYVIKFIASAKKVEGKLELWVGPALVRADHPLARVNGSFNGLFFEGEPIGSFALQGKGAGGGPTASAVLSDILSAKDYILNGNRPGTGIFTESLPVQPYEKIRNRHFIRMNILEKPGSLSEVSGIFGEYGISILSVEQDEAKTDGKVSECVFITRHSGEDTLRSAVEKINALQTQTQVQSVLKLISE